MIVDDELIDNLAELACLEFTEGERPAIKQDLERMIKFIEKLSEVDTTGVEPQLHMSDTVDALRADIPGGSVSRAEALFNAQETDGVFFKVPRVIKNPSANS